MPYRRKKLTFAISSADEFLYLMLKYRSLEKISNWQKVSPIATILLLYIPVDKGNKDGLLHGLIRQALCPRWVFRLVRPHNVSNKVSNTFEMHVSSEP